MLYALKEAVFLRQPLVRLISFVMELYTNPFINR